MIKNKIHKCWRLGAGILLLNIAIFTVGCSSKSVDSKETTTNSETTVAQTTVPETTPPIIQMKMRRSISTIRCCLHLTVLLPFQKNIVGD